MKCHAFAGSFLSAELISHQNVLQRAVISSTSRMYASVQFIPRWHSRHTKKNNGRHIVFVFSNTENNQEMSVLTCSWSFTKDKILSWFSSYLYLSFYCQNYLFFHWINYWFTQVRVSQFLFKISIVIFSIISTFLLKKKIFKFSKNWT